MDKIDQGLQRVLNAVGQGYRRHIQCIHGPFMVSLSRKPNKLMLKKLSWVFLNLPLHTFAHFQTSVVENLQNRFKLYGPHPLNFGRYMSKFIVLPKISSRFTKASYTSYLIVKHVC